MEEKFKTPKNNHSVVIEVRCKDCFHFKKERATKYADVCINLGILPVARPCKAYLANANVVSFKDNNANSFAQVLEKIPSNRLTLMAAFLSQEKTTRRQGFRHGQSVYVRLYAEDYLSNYAKAKVVLAWRGRVLVEGESGFRGSFLKASILTEKEYEKKQHVLTVRKRINDPRIKQYNIPRIKETIKVLKDYESPTIDGIIKEPVAKKHKGNDIYIRGDNVKEN